MSLSISRYPKKKHWSTLAAALAVISAGALTQGCGEDEIDCNESSTTGAYATGKSEGEAAATRLWGRDASNQPIAGSLTSAERQDIGEKVTYNAGRQKGYDRGYRSAEGYVKGEREGYAAGFAQGSVSTASCEEGTTLGLTDGYIEGLARGNHDGYHDGYNDGYNFGRGLGLYASCTDADAGASASEKEKTCKARGYNNAYSKAVETAKTTDTDYQAGLVAGEAAGIAAGEPAGVTAGYNAGHSAGLVRGRTDGRHQIFVDCYNDSFVNGDRTTGSVTGGVVQGYEQAYPGALIPASNNGPAFLYYGYGERPRAPSKTNGQGGLGVGVRDGFEDGRSETCGFPYTSTWYGYATDANEYNDVLEPWAEKIGSEIRDAHVNHYSAYMTEADMDTLDAYLVTLRAELRATAREDSGLVGF